MQENRNQQQFIFNGRILPMWIASVFWLASLKNVSSIDERERRSSRSFAPDLSNVITKFLSILTASVVSIGESGSGSNTEILSSKSSSSSFSWLAESTDWTASNASRVAS